MLLGHVHDTVLTVSGNEVDVIVDVYSLDDEYVDDYEVSTKQPIVDGDDLDYQEIEALVCRFRDKYYGRD
jgi:hypothetical protein